MDLMLTNCVPDQYTRKFLAFQDPDRDSLLLVRIRILPHQAKKLRKTLISTLLSLKTDVNVPTVRSKKNLGKN